MKLIDDRVIPVHADSVQIISCMERMADRRDAKNRFPKLYTLRQKLRLRQISGIKQILFSHPPLFGKVTRVSPEVN